MRAQLYFLLSVFPRYFELLIMSLYIERSNSQRPTYSLVRIREVGLPVTEYFIANKPMSPTSIAMFFFQTV